MSMAPMTNPAAIGAAAPSLPQVDANPTREEARQAAQEFESVFLAQFASVMLSSVKSDGLFGGGPGEDIYKSMLAEEYGKAMARAGSFGIADAVYREIIKVQEVPQP